MRCSTFRIKASRSIIMGLEDMGATNDLKNSVININLSTVKIICKQFSRLSNK